MDILSGQSQQQQQDTVDQESVVPLLASGTTILGLKVPFANAVLVASDGKESSPISDDSSQEDEPPEYCVHRTNVQKVLTLSDDFVATFAGYAHMVSHVMKSWPNKMDEFVQGKIGDSLPKTVLDGLHRSLLECYEEAAEDYKVFYQKKKEDGTLDECLCAILGSICDGVPQLFRFTLSGYKPVEAMYITGGSGEDCAVDEIMGKIPERMTIAQAVEIAARAAYRSGRFDPRTGGNFYAVCLANGSVTKYTALFNQLHQYFGAPMPVANHADPTVETLVLPVKTEVQIAKFVAKCEKTAAKKKMM